MYYAWLADQSRYPNQWQRRERDDVNDELGKPTNITRQPAEYSEVAEKVGEYLGGLGEYCSLYRSGTHHPSRFRSEAMKRAMDEQN